MYTSLPNNRCKRSISKKKIYGHIQKINNFGLKPPEKIILNCVFWHIILFEVL